jgi:hypothetical protein
MVTPRLSSLVQAPAKASVLSTYSAALISMLLAVLAAYTSVTHWDRSSLWQLVLVGLSAAGTYAIPLIPGRWSAWGKTGFAALMAAGTAFMPVFVHSSYTPQAVALVVLAGLQVIGTHLGVGARTGV